jgi:Ca2+:H+ antiporter
LPTLFDATAPTGHTETVSAFVAALLIISYLAYMLYEIVGLHGGWSRSASEEAEEETEEAIEELLEIEGGPEWSWQLSLFWLAATTIAVALIGNVLVDSVQPVVKTLGISEFFVGMVIIPIVGNVAEHFAAVQLAGRNKLDLTFAVASGSSVQVAVLVAPLLVLLSFIWHPMTLVFSAIEIAVLALSVIMFFFVMHDGETNWLEGLQLIVVYVMAAVVFYFLPSPHLL